MVEFGEAGNVWSNELLHSYLENPRGVVKGTNMAFAGLNSPQQRADVLAYLRTLSDNPPPLPTP